MYSRTSLKPPPPFPGPLSPCSALYPPCHCDDSTVPSMVIDMTWCSHSQPPRPSRVRVWGVVFSRSLELHLVCWQQRSLCARQRGGPLLDSQQRSQFSVLLFVSLCTAYPGVRSPRSMGLKTVGNGLRQTAARRWRQTVAALTTHPVRDGAIAALQHRLASVFARMVCASAPSI